MPRARVRRKRPQVATAGESRRKRVDGPDRPDCRRCRRAPADERRIARLKWVIGTPYFVQGTSNLAEIPTLYFIKFTLGMGEAGGQLFTSLRGLGWFVKPLWGLISDRVPIFGYRRKSWYVLMACLALVFWALTALLAAAGVGDPLVFLLTVHIAFDNLLDRRREARFAGWLDVRVGDERSRNHVLQPQYDRYG